MKLKTKDSKDEMETRRNQHPKQTMTLSNQKQKKKRTTHLEKITRAPAFLRLHRQHETNEIENQAF